MAFAGFQWEFIPKYFLQIFGNAGDAYFAYDLRDRPDAEVDEFDLDRAALGIGATLGWGSPLGPARLHAGYAGDGPVQFGFSVGYDF